MVVKPCQEKKIDKKNVFVFLLLLLFIYFFFNGILLQSLFLLLSREGNVFIAVGLSICLLAT